MRFDYDKAESSIHLKKWVRSTILWIIQILVVISLAYLFVHFGIKRITMVGDSMSPTLLAEDSIIVNNLSYRFSDPKRFDVIVFKQEGKEHSYYNIKRIIGLPGETVEIKDGEIYINGKLLEEKIAVEKMENGGLASEGYTLEEDEYFVLGDNRNDSVDSRFISFGTVLKSDIKGKAWIKTDGFSFISTLNQKPKEEKSEE